jgi:SAM-dependent methyltransferase
MTFDRWSDTYEAEVEHAIAFGGREHGFYLEAKVPLLLELARRAGPLDRVRALDVGCGHGALHPFLDRLPRLEGVDSSAAEIEAARGANPQVDYHVADARRLPFDDASFDFAFAVCVLHHVDRSDRPAAIGEMARVTRRGGIVAIVEHNPMNPLTRLVVARCAFDDNVELLRARVTRDLLRRARVEVDTAKYFLFFPTVRLRRLEKRMSAVPLGAQYVVAGVCDHVTRPSASW